MTNQSTSHSKFNPKIRLRTTLVMTFVVQIVAAVGLVGYLSFQNAQKAVNTLALQLRRELSDRIQQELKRYFETPHGLNQLNSTAFARGELDFAQAESVPQLIQQLKISPFLYAVYCGTDQGEFLGAVQILEDNTLGLWTANQATNNHLYLYQTDENGNRADFVRDRGLYDPRKRPWYQKALTVKRPVWSDVYLAFSTGLPTVTASQPIYDQTTGNLLGVCAVDVLLPDDFRQFLASLSIGKSGLAFVSDRQGQLISSSTDEPLTTGEGREAKLMLATASKNPLIRETFQSLTRQFGTLETLDQPLQTEFILAGKRQFVQVLPFQDDRGLDWLIVVVVPEADFMAEINANNRMTILLCLLALGVAIAAGILTARWISQPILQLSSASEEIARGQLNQHIKVQGITELETLATSFNSMARQLQESFANLEAKNADLQQAKEALSIAKDQLEAVLNAVPGSISWLGTNGVYLGVNRYLADTLNLPLEEIVGQEIGFVENSSEYVQFMRQFLASSEESASQIIPIDHQEDSRYYLIAVQKYQQGSAVVAVGIDVTERRRAEEERQRFTEQLFEANHNLELAMEAQLKLTEAANRFVPHQFLSRLGYQSIAEVNLGDSVEHQMSILFSDIRGFTALSESMTPADNFKFINAYLSRMEPAIAKHHGFIDKYIGDAIMALFDSSIDNAIQAGISMLKALAEYNLTRGRPNRPKLQIGIGINTGLLMLGTVGGQNRMDTTVISDAVNLASRIEGLTKHFSVPLLISEYTFKALVNPQQYAIRLVGLAQVKGKSEKVSVFEVFEADSNEIKAGKLKTKQLFEEAVLMYNQQQYHTAQSYFEKSLHINPLDQVAQVYLEKLASEKLSSS